MFRVSANGLTAHLVEIIVGLTGDVMEIKRINVITLDFEGYLSHV